MIPIKIALILLAAATLAACKTTGLDSAPPIIMPGAPGAASRTIGAEQAADLSQIQFTEADVKFMQGMISHHSQAIEMAALLPSRTSREDMKLLAQRIEVSQADEIKMMQEWLQARRQTVPGPHAHHEHGGMMPGMLTPEEMARLAASTGVEFDRLFLEGMIKHHNGALIMVQDLFNTSGSGQEADIFAFASDVDADQRMEIDRMGAMLKELQ